MVDAPPLLLSSYMEYKVLLGSILERTPFAFKNMEGKPPAWNFHKGERHYNDVSYYSGVKFLTPSMENMLDDVKRKLEEEAVRDEYDFEKNTDIAYLPYEISGRIDPKSSERIDHIQSYAFKIDVLNAYKAQMSDAMRDYSVQPGSFLYGLKEPLSSLAGADVEFTDYGLEAWANVRDTADLVYGRHSSAYDFPTLANATKTRYTIHVGEGYSSLHSRVKQSFDLLEVKNKSDYDETKYDRRVATRNLVDRRDTDTRKGNYSNVRPDFHYMVLRMDARYLREGERVQYGDFLCRLLGVDFDNPDGKPIDERLDSLGVKFLNWAISESLFSL